MTVKENATIIPWSKAWSEIYAAAAELKRLALEAEIVAAHTGDRGDAEAAEHMRASAIRFGASLPRPV